MSKYAPFGWAKRDGSFRTEVPDNPVGWTPLYAWTAFPWFEHADLLEAAKAMVEGGCVMDFESPEWAALEAAIERAKRGDA